VSAGYRVLGLASEYRRLCEQGRFAEAEGNRRDIETMVGRFEDGRLVLPRSVAQVMCRPDLGEVQP
jgi:hypothetical protein